MLVTCDIFLEVRNLVLVLGLYLHLELAQLVFGLTFTQSCLLLFLLHLVYLHVKVCLQLLNVFLLLLNYLVQLVNRLRL